MVRPRFGKVVSARRQLAELILREPEILAAFVEHGGLASDLEDIAQRGKDAEDANQRQSMAGAGGTAATKDLRAGMAALKQEHQKIRAVLVAVRTDLDDQGAAAELTAAVDNILEAEARGRRGDGAVLIEVRKDAAVLAGNAALAPFLAARRVDADRLQRLVAECDRLGALLAMRTVKKSGVKIETGSEGSAVTAQRRRWASVYLILSGLEHDGVRAMLRQARG